MIRDFLSDAAAFVSLALFTTMVMTWAQALQAS